MNQKKHTRSFRKFHLFMAFVFGIWISFVIAVGVSFVIARNSKSIEEMEIKSILIGAGSLFLTVPGAWFVLRWVRSIIQFIWEFILDRITEIANAVNKGKQVNAEKTK